METHAKEKRIHDRIPFTLEVKGKAFSGSGKKCRFQCITEDICFHGMRLKIHEDSFYHPDQDVKLKIRLYRGDFFLRATGKICWVRHSSKTPAHMNIGIRFTRIRRFNAWCDRINCAFCRKMVKDTKGSEICLQNQKDS